MAAVRHLEQGEQLNVLDHIVRFDLDGASTVVRIQAEAGKSLDYYYLKAIQKYRQTHKGEGYARLVPQEVITVTGQFDVEPPRANTDGYR